MGATAIIGEWFNKVAGVQIAAIPYKSVAQMLSDALSGQTQVVFNTVANMDNFRKAGKLRVIGVSSARRLPFLDDIPAISETLPGFRMVGVGIMAAPAGTPAAIIQRVNREVDAMEREPEYINRLQSFGITSSGAGTPQSIAEFIRGEREIWDRIMKGMDVQPQ